MNGSDRILVGLDGGGTGCRARLVTPDGRQVEAQGGPANVSDFDAALVAISATLRDLFASAGTDQGKLATGALHLGLAGVTGPAMAERVRSALAQVIPVGHITVSGDQTTTIAGALGAGDGAVAGIGTGSFVGRQSRGVITSLGGHGFLLGDQASGAWLGKRVLQELLLAADAIGSHSNLTRTLFDEHGGDRARIIAFAIAARPADFAALAPRVVAAASDGDSIAAGLMREGAGYIGAAFAALGTADSDPICLTGGLGPQYRNWLPQDIAARVVAVAGNALDGALALAGRRGAAT